MAHFAKLNENGAVIEVFPVANEIATSEAEGISFLQTLYKDSNAIWKQTSYNTSSGIHYTAGEDRVRTPSADQSKAFRGNYASVGGHYDSDKDIFVGKKPFLSWDTYDDTGNWQSPVPYPTNWKVGEDTLATTFDDDNLRWVGCVSHNPSSMSDFTHYWNSGTETWDEITS